MLFADPAHQRDDQRPRSGLIAVFAQVDALPDPEGQRPVAHRNRDARAQHRGFDVSGHVVGAFDGVDEGLVFGDHAIEAGFKIRANIGIGVFVDGQACRGVLDKDVQQSDADAFDLRNGMQHGGGDQVEAARHRLEPQGVLMPEHGEGHIRSKGLMAIHKRPPNDSRPRSRLEIRSSSENLAKWNIGEKDCWEEYIRICGFQRGERFVNGCGAMAAEGGRMAWPWGFEQARFLTFTPGFGYFAVGPKILPIQNFYAG